MRAHLETECSNCLTVAPRRWQLLRAAVWLATGLLFIEVLYSILIEYRWYFPPNFDHSPFLSGRRHTFSGVYRWAFYAHILSGPVAVMLGLLLVLSGARQRFRRFHRMAGRLQIGIVLGIVVPSGLVMAQWAYAGPPAVLGFSGLSLATGFTAAMAVYCAIRRQFSRHQRWASRCFLLLASPLLLRVISGATIVLRADSNLAYQLNAWLSWLVPWILLELYWHGRRAPLKMAEPAAANVPRGPRRDAGQSSPGRRIYGT